MYAQNSEKYSAINLNNYSEILTDLVGVRVLHLFKYEWLNIQNHILLNWEPVEQPVAYVRSGDEGPIIDSYKESDCEVKNHPAGYRSIHYVISTQPTLKKVFSEIQVRTIFEEGWSEIDHKIRYPNFSDNELISYFLTIFNRMSGSADEMGSFVKDLTAEISLHELKIIEAKNEQEKHLSKIEAMVKELSSEKKESKNKDNKVEKLNSEVNKLRSNPFISGLTGYPDTLNTSISDKLAAINTGIFNTSLAESLGALNTGMIGGGAAEKLAAMNLGVLNTGAASKLAALNTNLISGGATEKLLQANKGLLSLNTKVKISDDKK